MGGRLTLLKSVLRAVPIYNMSLFKTPKPVLHEMEMIRNRFFNGGDDKESRITWVAWEKVLSSKKNGGLGVSSFFALNRALLFKWIWRFLSQDEAHMLASKGFDFLSHCKIRVGDGSNTRFWLDTWILDSPLYVRFPRIFSLESVKDISVAVKWGAPSLYASFRRRARDGAESNQWSEFCSMLDSVTLSSSPNRIFYDLNGEGKFRVKDIRSFIDDTFLPSSDSATRWVKTIPIKVNILAWRTRLDRLPTRVNLIMRGVNIDSSLCSVCSSVQEDSNHLFCLCDLGKSISQRIFRWWNIQWVKVSTYAEWYSWFISIRSPAKLKLMLEGVFYTSWWHI
nr:hypothetical protein [Tanacetum cinerariifolium]